MTPPCWRHADAPELASNGAPALERELTMEPVKRDILISGASVAGPTLAYWLSRGGFTPVVVERTPALRAGLGGHAVDLLGPAVDVAEWMGVLPAAMAASGVAVEEEAVLDELVEDLGPDLPERRASDR